MVILIYGPSGVGKTTVGRALAGRMKQAAFVESDLVKYLVAGGLVAWSGGRRPKLHPREYRIQCEMMASNTARLACGFGAYGFDCVIEGLDETEAPIGIWAEEQLPGIEVRNVAIWCEPAMAMNRLKERGWRGSVEDLEGHRNWQIRLDRERGEFASIIDSTTRTVEECVDDCAGDLEINICNQGRTFGVEWEIVKVM